MGWIRRKDLDNSATDEKEIYIVHTITFHYQMADSRY